MQKPTQYLLCGLPFSGKTTLGKQLARRPGFVHINLDQIKADKGYGVVSDDDVSDAAWAEIFQIADTRLIDSLQRGFCVANETAWVTRAWRDRARAVAQKAGFPTRIVYLEVPEETVKRRWQDNKKKKKRYDPSESEFNGYIQEFEPPSAEEDVIVYDGKIAQDAWIQKTFHPNNHT